MTRMILTFELAGDMTMLKLDDAPQDIVGLGENEPVDVSQLPSGTLIERGEALLALLYKHQAVRRGLAAALAVPPGSAPYPLYFHMRAAAADSLPWEQIYALPHGFFALDQRWPVGRIAARVRRVTDRIFAPPLKIVAVLSAAGRAGAPQLQALLQAVADADATATGVSLHVISGEQAVLDAATGPGVTAELIAPTAPELARQLTRASRHVLHTLCHGGLVAGVRTLAFGHLADFEAGFTDSGSVRLSVPELLDALLPCNPWLLVLSACESAQASGSQDGPALAHDPASGGIPAVIGMRRLVDLTDTNRFCRALYPEVLSIIQAALAPEQPHGVRTIDWAAALTGPRKVMSGDDPSLADAWTDPVLYAQNYELRIFPPSDQLSPADYAGLRAKLDKFQGYLANLDPAKTASGLIDEVRSRIGELQTTLAEAGG